MNARVHRAGAQDRRNQVLEAAMYAIAEQGLDAVSMREIAVRAGMSPGHIMYYFGSKEVLLLEVLRWSEVDLAKRRRASLARIRGRDRKLHRFCGWYLPKGPGDPRWSLWAQIFARPPTHPDALEALLEMSGRWIEDLTAIVGDRAFAERHCALMDGLAMDVLLGMPGRTVARAMRIATESIISDPAKTTWIAATLTN